MFEHHSQSPGGNITDLAASYYNKSQTDALLSSVTPEAHTHQEAGITDLDKYTKAQTELKISDHSGLTNNPHGVTGAQVGLGNVENKSVVQIFSSTEAQDFANTLPGGSAHMSDATNPHSVTKSQVGLGGVPNVDVQALLNSHLAASNPHQIDLSFFDVFSQAETDTRILFHIDAARYQFTPVNSTDSAGAVGDIAYDSTNLHAKTGSTNWLTLANQGDSYTKAESNVLYEPIDTAYTKAESNALYEPIDTAYTKAEADARYEPLDSAYTKAEADAKYGTLANLALKANSADVYTKTEVDTAVALKANILDVYTQTEVGLFVNSAITSFGTSVYSKTEVDTAVALKADQSTTYTKTETDTAITNAAGAGLTQMQVVQWIMAAQNGTLVTNQYALPASGTLNYSLASAAQVANGMDADDDYAHAV